MTENILVNEISRLNYYIKSKEKYPLEAYCFDTKKDLFIEEYENVAGCFRIQREKDGELDVYVEIDDSYYVAEHVTYLFDVEKIWSLCEELATDEDNVTDDYLEWMEDNADEDDE